MMTNVVIDPRPIQTIIIAHIHITISPIHCNSRKTFLIRLITSLEPATSRSSDSVPHPMSQAPVISEIPAER